MARYKVQEGGKECYDSEREKDSNEGSFADENSV